MSILQNEYLKEKLAAENAGLNTNTSLNQNTHHNPLDRNHDGKVNLKDLAPHAGANPGLNQGVNNLNQNTHHNTLDRNHDGRIDARDVTPNAGLAHHNRLDRNYDGKVDLKDVTSNTRTNSGLNQGLNPLDRNGDGRIDSRDFASQGAYVQSVQRASLVRAEPTLIETVQKDVVVHERIHPIQKEEIQPIIYREREQLDVKQVTQMLHETQIQPTIIQQRELPAERRQAVVERATPIVENFVAPSSQVDATLHSQIVHAPIINEVIKKTIIEEIQPVLERDIIQSTVIQNSQPIYEKFVEAPQVYRETRIISERRMSGASLEVLAAQGFNVSSLTGLSANNITTELTTSSGLNNNLNLNSGLNRDTPLYSTSYSTSNSNRKSLAEALPASYSHLSSGSLTTDAKLAEAEALNRQSAPLSSNVL